MTNLTTAAGLVARLDQTEILNAFNRALEGQRSQTNLLMLLLGVVALCGLVALLAQIIYRRPRRKGPARIDHLAHGTRLLGLSRPELEDLRTVARRARLSHPASVLLSPANLAHAARAAQRGPDDARLRRRLNELSLKLFGTQLPTETGPR